VIENKTNIIIAGGGTGGHIFPAVAIAQGLEKNLGANLELLFVGAKGRMEMEKIPALGYKIEGLEVAGFQRSFSSKNLILPFKILKSIFQAFRIIRSFKPKLAIGVGGYASGPMLFVAAICGVPIVIQEQNSYPGITNKILSRWAKKIFVAYDGLDVFFDKEKIQFYGNPIRKDIAGILPSKENASSFFKLDPNKKTILVIGGSLGARTINQSVEPFLSQIDEQNYQLIWQTGKLYYDDIQNRVGDKTANGIIITEFLTQMDMAYAAADIIISRAGALSISELCIIGKPVIFVPSPNVSEDHQTKNAMALVDKNAAILVRDNEAKEKLLPKAFDLIKDETLMVNLSTQIAKLAKPNASGDIVNGIISLIK
jgi:UDP-N-acetylglucosamine--N-acetylmuramyl-(pentapeptide) pyrophosphoryl-undecaprenol N-acetylglucosamine transferase